MKRESTAVIANVMRKRILSALIERERATVELATDLNIESSELIRIVHDMCLQRLIRQRPISAPARKRYKDMHDVLLAVMAGELPASCLDAYSDCVPVPYQATKAGRAYLNG